MRRWILTRLYGLSLLLFLGITCIAIINGDVGFPWGTDQHNGDWHYFVDLSRRGLLVWRSQSDVYTQWQRLPFKYVISLSLAPAVILGLLHRRNKPGEHDCPACGYDLRATPERCPECGTETKTPVH